jgi:hypothetical protein
MHNPHATNTSLFGVSTSIDTKKIPAIFLFLYAIHSFTMTQTPSDCKFSLTTDASMPLVSIIIPGMHQVSAIRSILANISTLQTKDFAECRDIHCSAQVPRLTHMLVSSPC